MLPFVVHTDPKGVAGSCFQGRLEKKDGLRQGIPDFARPTPTALVMVVEGIDSVTAIFVTVVESGGNGNRLWP